MSTTPPASPTPRFAGRLALALLVVLAGCGDAPRSDAAPPDPAPPSEPGGVAVSNGVVRVSGATARSAPAGGVSAVFFDVENTAGAADTLVAARAEAAEQVEVHRTTTGADGMRGMEEVPGVAVPAGGAVAFEPGGLHVMLVGLRSDLAEGDTVYVDLDFARGPSLTLPAPVRGLD